MDADNLSPLDVLAICLAYAAMADKEVVVQERASMVAILSKLVRLEDLSEAQLHDLSSNAFKYAGRTRLENFATVIRGRLTHAQALSVLANMTDVVLSDGFVRDGEVRAVETVRQALGVEAPDYRALREVLTLKNDTGLFTNHAHPWNEKGYALRVQIRADES